MTEKNNILVFEVSSKLQLCNKHYKMKFIYRLFSSTKENPLKMAEFLKNKYFLMKSLLAIIIFLKKTSFSKKNVLVLPKFLKNKNFVKG
jgi:hypothetical protein